MKKISRKQIIVIVSAVIAISVLAIFASVYKYNKFNDVIIDASNQDVIDEKAVAVELEMDFSNLENPIVGWQDGEFVFLSGGYDNIEDVSDGRQTGRVMVYLGWDSRPPVYYTHDWQLDSYDVSSNEQVVIYSTFHTQARIYRVYRYDVGSGENTVLSEFDITDSTIFSVDHSHIPFSTLEITPDAEHYYLYSYSSHFEGSLDLENQNFVQATNGGELTVLDIPENIYQQYWFSNSKVAFSGANFAGSKYEEEYVQIYDIYTHEVSSTKIPTRGSMSGLSPKVSPDSTAYAYYDITENHGYACGGRIMDMVVVSYPDGEELFRLEDLHELEYRWLVDDSLEITYTRIPEIDGEYTPRSQTGQETLDAIKCAEQEVMYFNSL